MRSRATRGRFVALVVAAIAAAGCGKDVDLGGAPDAGPPPDGPDADRCGAIVGPSVDASCRACAASSPDCQANGCYGGFWCDTSIRDCQKPPKSCP